MRWKRKRNWKYNQFILKRQSLTTTQYHLLQPLVLYSMFPAAATTFLYMLQDIPLHLLLKLHTVATVRLYHLFRIPWYTNIHELLQYLFCFLTFSHSKLHTVTDREKIISASVVGNSAVCKNLQRVCTVLILNAKLWNIYFSTVGLVAQIPDAQIRYTVKLKLSFRTVLDGWLLKNLEDQMIVWPLV